MLGIICISIILSSCSSAVDRSAVKTTQTDNSIEQEDYDSAKIPTAVSGLPFQMRV